MRLPKRWTGKVVFEIQAVKEVLLFGVGRYEQRAQLEIVRKEVALAVDSPRNVEPRFEPIGHPVGKFRCPIKGVIRDETAGKVRRTPTIEGVVEVILDSELADLGDLGIIDLDFVDRPGEGRCS